jgi:precorrin-6B methylase 1
VNLLDQYIDEIEKDLQINEFNLKDSSMKTPARKHYWVSKLIRHKKNLLILRKQRDIIKKDVTQKLIEESPVKITLPVAEKASYKHEKMKEISEKINEEELIIEFLEKTEKTFSAVGFDIKNIIEIMKMEQL